MLKKTSYKKEDIMFELEPEFMPLNQFLTDEKIKNYTDKEQYDKMKLSMLQTLIQEKNKIKSNNK